MLSKRAMRETVTFCKARRCASPPHSISCDVPNLAGANRPTNFILQLLPFMAVPVKVWAFSLSSRPFLTGHTGPKIRFL